MLSEYTVTSRYVTTRIEQHHSLLSLAGDIFEEDGNGEFRAVTGQFMIATAAEEAKEGRQKRSVRREVLSQ
jgi:hypothetical protein